MSEHSSLSATINAAIADQKGKDGLDLRTVQVGDVILVQTENSLYTIKRSSAGWTIEGNPRYCPSPAPCCIHGSTWGGTKIKVGWIVEGMRLQFDLLSELHTGKTVKTSTITKVSR